MRVQKAYLRVRDKNETRQATTLWIVGDGHIIAIIDWDGFGDHFSEWSVWVGKDNAWCGHVHGFKTRAEAIKYLKGRMD